VLAAGPSTWLPWLGWFLVDADRPEAAEVVVVLGGDVFGARVLKAAALVEQGYAPKALVSGPVRYFGRPETDLSIPFAVERGAPREIFEALPLDVDSTWNEALAIDRELRRRGIGKAIVVTSNFHTRRARELFERYSSGEVQYLFSAAPHPEFDPDGWWQTRAGKKILVIEYLKTFYSWIPWAD